MDNQKLSSFYKNKKILVTGHTGFKGSWLTMLLKYLGAEVAGYSLEPATTPSLFRVLGLNGNVKNYFSDIRDFETVKSVFEKEKPEIVFHLAAQPLVRDSYDDPLYTFQTNILGTANILEAIRLSEQTKTAVMVTTDKVYENKESSAAYKEGDELGGHDPYSTSKACAEFVVRCYNRSFFQDRTVYRQPKSFVASARSGNVIGGGDWSKDRLVPDIVRAVYERQEKVLLRNPASIRPWQFVLEPLLGYLLLARKLFHKEASFIGAWNFSPESGNFIQVEEMTKRAFILLGKGEYAIKEDKSKYETSVLKLDSQRAKKELGCKAVLSLHETLSWTFQWYKDFYLSKDMGELTKEQIKAFLTKAGYG
ncbi:MAG: CDP-glucose 4,6-dehydratase [Candidatus Omnitrophica bacterium]|nr:CDP-glucose 4,6-dehydratase [Candidatus Omnitrophota bacterium]